MTTTLWTTLPYVAFTSFLLGHLWRYRNDQFGWTTRSSQIYESRLLRLGSPLFHFGMLGVIGGHVVGVLIPASWTAAIGISEHLYHVVAVSAGTVAGVAVIVGIAILLYRRVTVPAVRKATTRNDKLMYVLLAGALITGMLNTVGSNLLWGTYNYRETVSPWFRSLFTLHPQPELMVGTPWTFQAHGLIVLALIGVWPYTRLVHMFSAPIGYFVRPYVVYRSKPDTAPDKRRYARAWDSPVLPPR
ncbi:respiratory nitrate reductase subunit gamma [Nocardia otitidiscaviarum]|uniref:respiratory nitrate reductase subunit gamma n=1 Tax=Nocardia otitidiscaviarum TaxID=1823 RepID=UPI0004A6C1C4|nr:respiratory nitrate reductase subunit gamma [Nocardia otitidiscaviarum]MBF6131980.1 respiratory nitrate reductase subunit gamma [Nocardia otitidiscaviarum]MBF6483111.1 respiratory nitrate reductase subunit gamma [Nocardia otitidiscaviarum]